MSAADQPIEMRPEEKQAWRYVIRTKLEQALEAAPSPEEFLREMGREYIRIEKAEKVLQEYPDSALADMIRLLQEEGFSPDSEQDSR